MAHDLEKGKTTGAMGIFRSIAEHKQIKGALAEKHNLLRTLIDNLPDCIFIKDRKSRFVISNIVHVRTIGATIEDEVVGKTDFDFFPKKLATQYYDDEQEIIRSGQPLLSREEPVIDQTTDSRKWFLTTKVPLRNTQGKIICIIGISRDITEQKMMENKLKKYQNELEERVKERTKELAVEYNLLQTLMDNIPDFIYFKDKKSRFIKVNKTSADDVSITPEGMIGKTDFDFFPEKLAKKCFADDNLIMESNEPLIDKLEISTSRDGKKKWSTTTKIPRYNEKGEAIGIMGISRNITKHKKAEEELRKTQERLIRSEKLATLGKLTGAVGHELRNPLGAIKNSVYFLRMRLDRASEDEKVKKHLDILEEEINISDKIITDMLTFGRIKEPQLAPANINNIIKGCLRESKAPPNIKVSTKLNSQLPQIQADEAQLKEVFSNIILNAIQAMPKGGELTVTTARKDEFVEVAIANTGEGISKENLEKIFDPLFSTKPRGTGLGLSVCQSIIEGHKGAIEVKSEARKKTKFIVKLPITN